MHKQAPIWSSSSLSLSTLHVGGLQIEALSSRASYSFNDVFLFSNYWQANTNRGDRPHDNIVRGVPFPLNISSRTSQSNLSMSS